MIKVLAGQAWEPDFKSSESTAKADWSCACFCNLSHSNSQPNSRSSERNTVGSDRADHWWSSQALSMHQCGYSHIHVHVHHSLPHASSLSRHYNQAGVGTMGKSLPLCGVLDSHLYSGHMWPRTAIKAVQYGFINLLKTLWIWESFFFLFWELDCTGLEHLPMITSCHDGTRLDLLSRVDWT